MKVSNEVEYQKCQDDKLATFTEAAKGDKKALQKVIETYTPMVHMWAHNYKSMCPDFVYDDLVQEGVEAIVHSLKTFEYDRVGATGKPISPSTWIWWKTRASVQKAARRFQKQHNALSLDAPGHDQLAELGVDPNSVQRQMSQALEMVIEDLYGNRDNYKAEIIKDRFGLFGKRPLKQTEISEKHGISKKAARMHITRFMTEVKRRYPELKETIQ